MNKTSQELFQEREKRVNDAIQLKVPDRVPLVLFFTFFQAKYAGITFQEAMYDYDKAAEATRKAVLDFDPDMYLSPFPIITLGPLLEILDDKRFKWPGHGVPINSTYQYVESETMTVEEYDAFIADPTDYILRTHMPKVMGALSPLKMISYLPANFFLGLTAFYPMAFGIPEVRKAMEKLLQAGQEAFKMATRGAAFQQEMASLGYPTQFGAFTTDPFDYIGDYFRGTRGIMLDMYQRPEKIMEVMDKLVPILIRSGIDSARASGIPRAFIATHKGLDGFMSPNQFNTFYWPTLRKVMMGLIEQSIVPFILWEGDCTSRLETIVDIPKGKAVYWFERTDLFKAKEILRNHICIRGGPPVSMLCTGTPKEVQDYCKRLIDVVGEGGGFMLDGPIGIPDETRPENLRAMVDFAREYGRYE